MADAVAGRGRWLYHPASNCRKSAQGMSNPAPEQGGGKSFVALVLLLLGSLFLVSAIEDKSLSEQLKQWTA